MRSFFVQGIFHETLFLRRPNVRPCSVYTCEIQDSARVLLILNPEFKDRVHKDDIVNVQLLVRDKLQSLIEFLLVKQSDRTMISYLHGSPGLVHFIYIERHTPRMVAPNFCPLHRMESESEEFRKLSADYVRRETWKMFHKLQPFIFKGCTSVLLKAKKFQYCYRLWFEDENKREVTPHQAINTKLLYRCGGLEELTRELFPHNRNIQCYELYTLFIGLISYEYIQEVNLRLVRTLRDQMSN